MRRTAAAVAAILVLWLNGTAQASPITGSLWAVNEAVAQNAIPANVPLTAPDVTFDVNAPLNFNLLHIGPQTVVEWLLSGGAFNINGSIGALNRPMEVPGSMGTIVEFLGFVTVTTGQPISAAHDDGITLIIGATNLGFANYPGGFVIDSSFYGGPSGTFPFQLVYADCCGSPAFLQLDLPFQPQAVPEPTTLALLGIGALGLIAKLRRRKHQNS